MVKSAVSLLLIIILWFPAEKVSGQSKQCTNSLQDRVLQINRYVASLPDAGDNLDVNLQFLDSIYVFALLISDNDASEALLALTFSNLTFRYMPVHDPVFNIKIKVPLPFVDSRRFKNRIKKIPKVFFFDSPKTNYSDRDKAAHFWGNAFLAFNLNLFNFTKLIGIFIELFEDNFKVDGTFSVRDIRTNLLGETFGNQIRIFPDLMPSTVIYIYNYYFQARAGESLL